MQNTNTTTATTHHPFPSGEQGDEEHHHHHQYNTRFQEKWEMDHPLENGNGQQLQQQQQSEAAVEGEEEDAVVYEVHYSEEHQRDYYVHPHTKSVSWFAPNVSIPSNGIDSNSVEVPYSPRYQQKETPKDSGRLAILAAVAFAALGMQLWAKLWIPDEILSKVPSPLQVVTLTAIKPIAGGGKTNKAETVPSPQTSEHVSEASSAENLSSESTENDEEPTEEEILEADDQSTETAVNDDLDKPVDDSVEETPGPEIETTTTTTTPSEVNEEESEKTMEDPRKMAEAVAKAMVNSFASKGENDECADDSQWERNVVLPAELNPLEASFDEQVNSILERIQSQMNENERRHYIKEVSKSDDNLCKFPLSHRFLPHCKDFKWDSEFENDKSAKGSVAVVKDE